MFLFFTRFEPARAGIRPTMPGVRSRGMDLPLWPKSVPPRRKESEYRGQGETMFDLEETSVKDLLTKCSTSQSLSFELPYDFFCMLRVMNSVIGRCQRG